MVLTRDLSGKKHFLDWTAAVFDVVLFEETYIRWEAGQKSTRQVGLASER